MENSQENHEKEIEIVEPTLEDVRDIIQVRYQTWLATYPNEKAGVTVDDVENRYKDRFSDKRIQRWEKLITNPEPGEKVLIAKNNENVVGFCIVVVKEDRNQLQAIYILPEYHGKGIGTKLWVEVQQFLDPVKDTYVEVADYNNKAINFYNKLGFVDTGRRFTDESYKMKSGATIPEIEMMKKAEQLI